MVQVFVFDLADGKTLDVCRGHAGILLVHPGFCLIVIESVFNKSIDGTNGISVPLKKDLGHSSGNTLRKTVGLQASNCILVECNIGINIPVEIFFPHSIEFSA